MNRDAGAQRQAAREVLHREMAERFGFRKGDDSPDLEAGSPSARNSLISWGFPSLNRLPRNRCFLHQSSFAEFGGLTEEQGWVRSFSIGEKFADLVGFTRLMELAARDSGGKFFCFAS